MAVWEYLILTDVANNPSVLYCNGQEMPFNLNNSAKLPCASAKPKDTSASFLNLATTAELSVNITLQIRRINLYDFYMMELYQIM